MQYLACTLPVTAVATKRNALMFSVWCQSKLLTAFALNCLGMRDDFDQVMKHWDYVFGKTMDRNC